MASSSESQTESGVVIALNGFLGRTTDWPSNLAPQTWAFKPYPLGLITSFETWAETFNSHVRATTEAKRVLLGYSMGGRLAMHALINDPSLYAGAVFISANPGLLTDEERRVRVTVDERWATKFSSEPWDQLMAEWDQQTTLLPPEHPSSDLISLTRKEADFSRDELAEALRVFSLGRQRDLRQDLAQLKLPIEFITGQDDLKFTALTRVVSEQTRHLHRMIANAGHRVPWDAPAQTRSILADFLRTV